MDWRTTYHTESTDGKTEHIICELWINFPNFQTTTPRNPVFKQPNAGGVDMTNIFNQKQFKPASGGFVQSQRKNLSFKLFFSFFLKS